MADPGSNVRMAGYLEKRGKLKLMGSWKKYWFVLEGQLLLYYKSQLEYINLSACRGSLNIGLASCVRPGQGLTIQVVTRTQCTTLRTKERALQEQWLQALLDSMALPNMSSLKRQSAGPQHFRYSLDNLPAINESEESSSKDGEKKTTLPRRISRGDSMLFRIRRMGGISYGGNSEGILSSMPRMKAVGKVFNGKLMTQSPSNAEVYKRTTEESQDIEGNDPSIVSETENMSEEAQSKDKFSNNLATIRDLLEQTNKVSEETSSLESPQKNSNQHSNEELQNPSEEKLEEVCPVEEHSSKTPSEEQDSSTESTEHSEKSDSLPGPGEETEILTTALIHDENQNSGDIQTGNKLDQYQETMKENTYCYESLKTIATSNADIEEDHYSSYDRFALMQNLSEGFEPTVPPRPNHEMYVSKPQEIDIVECSAVKTEKKHVFMDKLHQLLKKTPSKEKESKLDKTVVPCKVVEVEDEEDYYSCYDRLGLMQNVVEEVEPTLPPRPDHEIYKTMPQELDSTRNAEEAETKQQFKDKLHQLLKKSPSKELSDCQKDKTFAPSMVDEEEDYYSCYDRLAVMQNVSEEIEPTLPPRPDHEIYKNTSQEVEFADYSEVKAEKKHVFRDKLHQLLKKTPSKELKDSQSETQQPKKTKRRRSRSFLKALGFRPKKKERKPTNTYEEDSDEEPEYESVDYMVQAAQRQLLEQQLDQEQQQQLHKMLPVNAMLELKHKLRGRSIEHIHSDEESEIYEAILGIEAEERRSSVNSSQIEEKSITTSTSSQSSTSHVYACHNKPKKTKQPSSLSLAIPSLPPRRAQRPPSPWHDIPTNNSPVYGDGNFSLNPANDSSSDNPFYLVHPSSNAKVHSNFPIVPDEILNTPEGFLYIQSRWRQAEQAREWNREQQMVAFPSKGRSKLSETLGREKVDINGNADELHNIDNDSLTHGEECEDLDNLNRCDEDSQPDSLEKNINLESQDQEEEVKCSKDETPILDGVVLHEVNGHTERNCDSDVELRIQPQAKSGGDTPSPVQQEKCIEFQLVDFSSNGNNHDLTAIGLQGHGILSNQEHTREIMSINRYSDELHLLLAQLAEITSAPLYNAIGATKSLITQTTTQSTLDEELGPIRRRRHSDPDYDIPRPHGSLQIIVQDTPDPSMSPDSLEPTTEDKQYLKDMC